MSETPPKDSSTNTTEIPISEPDRDLLSTSPQNPSNSHEDPTESEPSFDQNEILRALEVVDRDSKAIAESYISLFSSLRLALSQVTSSSVEHMRCFNDVAGRLQESALDASTKGNHYINSCLRLNEEMKGIDNLAVKLKILRRNVDALDVAVNKLVRFP